MHPARVVRWLALVCLLLLGSVASAHATPKQVVINSPVDGRVSSSPFESPPHHIVHGQWAFDIHTSGQARPVYARFGPTNGNLTLEVSSRSASSCRIGGGGWRVTVTARVDGVHVGDVYYLHLANPHPGGAIANGAQIGTTAVGLAQNPSCWTGPHVHVEGINRSGSASCARHFSLNTDLGGGSAIGVIGGDWAGANNQACPEAAFNVGPGAGGGGDDPHSPIGHFDEMRRHPGGVWVRGWIVDPDSHASTAVHVYAGTGGLSASNPQTALPADLDRPDVAAAIGKGAAHGFSGFLPLNGGRHTVCIYGINIAGTPGGHRQISCKTMEVSPEPFGALDSLRRAPGGIAATGWVLDPDTDAPINVHLYSGTGLAVAGNNGVAHLANRPHGGVSPVHPGFSDRHGFDGTVKAAAGRHTVCAYAINAPRTLGQNHQVGCKTMTVSPEPFGVLESVTKEGDILIARGWAIDPDTDTPINVRIHAGDGTTESLGVQSLANQPHAEAARRNPGWGTSHGYVAVIAPVRPVQTLCAYATNAAGTPGSTQRIGCLHEHDFRIAPPKPPPAGTPPATHQPPTATPPSAKAAPARQAAPVMLRAARVRSAAVLRRGPRVRIGISAIPGRAFAGRRVLIQRKVGRGYRALMATKVQRNGKVRAIITLNSRKRGLRGTSGVRAVAIRLALPKTTTARGWIGPARAISLRNK